MSNYDLIFFDLHTAHDDDMVRHKALGNMILEERPNNLISGGDFLSLDSCSSYDVVKRCSMDDDRRASERAHDLIFGPLHTFNRKRKKKPNGGMGTYFLYGNHEFREKRVREIDPDGFASLVDYDEIMAPYYYWDERVGYGEVVTVNDISYTHVPLGKTQRPMGTLPIAKQTRGHLIYGHTHYLDVKVIPQIATGNSVRMVVNAPALLPQDQKEHYCKMSTTGWVYGLMRVRSHGPTRPFSFDFITTEELIAQYT